MDNDATREQARQFSRVKPSGFFVSRTEPSALYHYLLDRGWLSPDETVRSIGKAGEGNMNLTLRLQTSKQNLILKQSRPWVEKYPQIPAPGNRALVESRFYELASQRPALAEKMPELIATDLDSCILLLDDLGQASDFTSIYRRGSRTLTDPTAEELLTYLVSLHAPFELDEATRSKFANREMRRLNHEHVFELPCRANSGIDLDTLTPGLAAASNELLTDAYVERVHELGQLYLADGPALLHGDFYPGSWLRVGDEARVIDPEFCFLGPAAFDLGVFTAHLYFADQDRLATTLVDGYRRLGGVLSPADEKLSKQFAGVELMRRLLGVAQLPMERTLAEKRRYLSLSADLILDS